MEEKQRLSLPDLLLKSKGLLILIGKGRVAFLRGLKSLKQDTYLTDIQTKLNQDHFHTSGNPLLFAL